MRLFLLIEEERLHFQGTTKVDWNGITLIRDETKRAASSSAIRWIESVYDHSDLIRTEQRGTRFILDVPIRGIVTLVLREIKQGHS